MGKLSQQEIEQELQKNVRRTLELIGEDPQREGLQRTPLRVSKALQKLTCGYDMDPQAVLNAAKFKEDYSQMVVVKDIDFFSLCEHHILPFYGKAHVAYIPNGYITQERMTCQIKECIQQALNPLGVMVVLEAQHMCMQMRGVEKQHSVTVTSDFTGAFNQSKTRAEFLELIKIKHSNQ